MLSEQVGELGRAVETTMEPRGGDVPHSSWYLYHELVDLGNITQAI